MAACQHSQDHCPEPIAVVGTGVRLPGSSNDPSALWNLLLQSRDLLSPIPDDRFNPDAFYHPDPNHHGTSNVRHSYFLEQDIRQFDARFFNIKPIEAHALDPQQRLLLEVVYESLEAGGLSIQKLAGSRTGVYVGLMSADYNDHLNNDVNSLPTYTPTGNARSIMSNRISYFFDWHGPSMTIDTACSSSLVAVHQAVELLRSGESDVAIAAGTNLILGPMQYIGSSKLHMLSADSRSRMWDANASGYARGEGVASVVLKRLSSAIADGDHIECIIRSSGVNQDGRTKGITMPSASAQAALIARTYARAGLNPKDPSQRCQYFEAHGTGTAAGDPQEAEAISSTFFETGEDVASRGHDPLFVGSIKTIVGHSEGTAGIAGLLRASLALQHGIVPPNALFNELSPAVEPFYTNLEIPTVPRPWPKLSEGTVRRASVNSFGFGGTNAHVILEQAHGPMTTDCDHNSTAPDRQLTPCNFSAASEKSLRGLLSKYLSYLQAHPDVSLSDLSYTLYARRSEHGVRFSIPAKSTTDLASRISELILGDHNKIIGAHARNISQPLRILGVFTGQGAQWALMGKELVQNIPQVKAMVEELDAALHALPQEERPAWSLLGELLCDTSTSRITTALVGQPLCTMIQVILYDLLVNAGIQLDSIVGHSGGEIAAAYAAGFIRRDEAMKIAYYRGFIIDRNPLDIAGGMMAVGSTIDDVQELCDLPKLRGRLGIAAINSASSVTISGDLDAIHHAKEILDDEGTFARILRVDKAYHSHHMVPSAKLYTEALQRLNIQPQQQTGAVRWYSSVFENRVMGADCDLSAQYWADNLVRPVIFSHAVECAAEANEFDLAVEIGPHPTLKGPALQTLPAELPYTGVLSRNKDDIEAFAEGLGYIWSHFQSSIVDFSRHDMLASGSLARRMVRGLPTYCWDHEKPFWHNSRPSKALYRSRNRPNPLLGSRVPDLMDEEMRWRNSLRLSELPWIRGHTLQGQVVFPATAYLATVVEGARQLVSQPGLIAVIEVQDFALGKPLVFKDDDGGIETLFTLSNIAQDGEGTISACFTYHACSNVDTETLSTHATGNVVITTSGHLSVNLPPRPADPPNTHPISGDQFYASLEPLGYGYTGLFKTVSSIQRKLNFASATVQVPTQDDASARMLLHPALLDSALQVVFLAYCSPDDSSLEQLHVPTGVKSFRVNVPLCAQQLSYETEVPVRAELTDNPLATRQLTGDIDVFGTDGAGLVQFEGVKVVAFAEPTSETDRPMFSHHEWGVAEPDAELAMGGARAKPEDLDVAYATERVTIHYMKQIIAEFPETARRTLDLPWNPSGLFDFFERILGNMRTGTALFSHPEWLDDTEEDVASLKLRLANDIDMRLVCTVGGNLSSVLKGKTAMIEHLATDNLLDRFYEDGLGLEQFSTYLARTVKQIVHRHPRMNILEIGAGTGGATKKIISEVGRTFRSYTYTDVSAGFFDTARQVFPDHADKMVFRTLNVENDPTEQGFEENSFDLIVASLVLHATKSLDRTLANVRRLLRPGGYLIITEVTNNDVARVGFGMCGMPGWWLGEDDGRRLSPCISTSRWHELLSRNGFDGVKSSTPEADVKAFPLAVIVSQAVDDSVELLHDPLSPPSLHALVDREDTIVLIGGRTLASMQPIEKIGRILQRSGIEYTVLKTLEEVDRGILSSNTGILCLAELDEPVFKRLTPESLQALQMLFEAQRTILWITQGSRAEEPYMNMTVGLCRTLILENEDLATQFLDLEFGVAPDANQLLECLIRLRHGSVFERDGSLNTMLWTNEQELALCKGKIMVSRVHHSNDLNDRFNASRRTIRQPKNSSNTPVELLLDSESKYYLGVNYSLATSTRGSDATGIEDNVSVIVSHSLLVPSSAAHPSKQYLVIGRNTATQTTTAAVSSGHGSLALAPANMALPVKELPPAAEPPLLAQLKAQLQANSLISECRKNAVLLVFKASPELEQCIAEHAKEAGIAAFFIASSAVTDIDNTRIKVLPYSPKRVVQSLLPKDVSVFADFSIEGKVQRTRSLIASCLPDTCLSLAESQVIDSISPARFAAALQRAVASLSQTPGDSIPVVRANDLVGQSNIDHPGQKVIDWSRIEAAPVSLPTAESLVMLRSDRTYVLFGLTSDLAQSICDWMASRGARNIVLTSRNPKIDPAWTRQAASSGLRIQAFANDITNKESLCRLVDNLRREWPPIAGIAHGAMVLDDVSFFEMPFEKMDKVLGPKVKGASYLDEIFHDASLDFFVLFSSVTAVAGNRGQSAYNAANLFMTALAHRRRQQGLAASVWHIGAVTGVGYITRQGSVDFQTIMRKAGFGTISERALHLCFAEAVLASHPGAGRRPEVITALETRLDDGVTPPWTKLPRFQHCLSIGEMAARKLEKQAAAVSTKSLLLNVTTPEEAMDVVSEALFSKLQTSLQLSSEHDKSAVLSAGTDDLGVDSLIAVEIRSWLLREIETDVPVFKILSGGTVAELLEYAIQNLPERLTPNLLRDSQDLSVDHTTTASSNSDPGDSQADTQLSSDTSAIEMAEQDVCSNPDPPSLSDDFTESSFDKIVPISPGQSRFWFLKHLLEDQTTANNSICVSIKGPIRLDNFERGIQAVTARHSALRTCFFAQDGQRPLQAILPHSRLHLETVAISDKSEVFQEFERLKSYVYDLEHGESMRLIHLSMTPSESWLLIGSHHIVMDGVSLEIFLNDLQKAYNGQSLGAKVYQYADYSERLRQQLERGELQEHLNYWKTELANAPEPLPLMPFVATRSRSGLSAYDSISLSRNINPALAEHIAKTCRQLKANVFHFYLGVFKVLLSKLYARSEICIGMADANRLNDEVASSVGMYLNLLPLIFRVDSEQSFAQVLKETRKKAYLAMAHSELPFDIMLECANLERSPAFSPLFQAFINYRQGVSESRRFGDAAVIVEENALPKAAYDISLDIIENPGDETRIIFMLQKGLYEKSDAQRVLDMYFKLLEDFAQCPTQSIREVSLFSDEEVESGMKVGRGLERPSEWPETLAHRIDQMIARHPSLIALTETSGQTLTYAQLDSEAKRIAAALAQAGVAFQQRVAVFQEPSALCICSLIAIFRLGAVYVPLDTIAPSTRLSAMLSQCKPSAILADDQTKHKIPQLELPSDVAILDASSCVEGDHPAKSVILRSNDTAAILFTSGTTGVPKGVVLSHAGFTNQIEGVAATHGFGRETVLQQSSLAFDMSLNQIFMALAHGGNLVIVPETLRRDPQAIAEIILEHRVTYTTATPSEYLAWLRHGSDSIYKSTCWGLATAGGEQFSSELVQAFQGLRRTFAHPFRAFNAYGPTEGTLSACEIEVDLETSDFLHATSSKAIPNCTIYIMDEEQLILPPGFVGEICIGGPGVAMQYLDNPEATRDKFVKYPNISPLAAREGWHRIYRTGDRGRLGHDGGLEILGRIDGDTQIKLRGLRIELQDIEQSILQTSGGKVKEVVVVAIGDPAVLVAYAILSPTAAISDESEYLSELAASLPLPQYMRPAAVVVIKSLPLTATGKIDRRALQEKTLPATAGIQSTRELSDLESALATVWREVLPQQTQAMHTITDSSDFFHVGGNSMLLIELRQRLRKRFEVELSLLQLFEHSHLDAMAAAIRGTQPATESEEVDWDRETDVPAEFSSSPIARLKRERTSHRVVVLTGATGFLGRQLLRLLVQDPRVDTIHCIAVRDRSRLPDDLSAKVVVHDGDLSSPRCSLSEAQADFIFENADTIIHNGADVSFLKSYGSLRESNVTSTKDLFAFAAARGIPFHFISSASVGRFVPSDVLLPESMSNFPPGRPIDGVGYAASKWASEIFLEKAHATYPTTPIVIHRPSSITGIGANDTDIVANVLKYAYIVKALPDSSRWKGYVDLISIERAAEGMVGAVFAGGDGGLRFMHHAGERVVPAKEVGAVLGDQAWRTVSMQEWVDLAVAQGMSSLVGEFLRKADTGEGIKVGQKLIV